MTRRPERTNRGVQNIEEGQIENEGLIETGFLMWLEVSGGRSTVKA